MKKMSMVYRAVRNFLVVVCIVFTFPSLTNAAQSGGIESKIQEQLANIDNITNVTFGNVSAMKAELERLKKENEGLNLTVSNLQNELSKLGVSKDAIIHATQLKTTSAQLSGSITAKGLSQQNQQILSMLLTQLKVVSDKLERIKSETSNVFDIIPQSVRSNSLKYSQQKQDDFARQFPLTGNLSKAGQQALNSAITSFNKDNLRKPTSQTSDRSGLQNWANQNYKSEPTE